MLRVAVITPYLQEPIATLRHCHESVAAQTYASLHVMVGDGMPNPEIDSWPVDHIRLPCPHADIGSTPRLIGAVHAIGLDIDAIAFLDADNWYREDHIAGLIDLHKSTGANFLTSGRMLTRLDGSLMAQCKDTNPQKFVDTSCMMFMRPAFHILAHWVLMPRYAHLIGDRVILHHVRTSGIKSAHSNEPSLFYRCGKAGIYKQLGEPLPDGVVDMPNYNAAFEHWIQDGYPELRWDAPPTPQMLSPPMAN